MKTMEEVLLEKMNESGNFEAVEDEFDPNQLESIYEAMHEYAKGKAELLEACVEFVRKVECGEARSKHSYKQMKEAIKETI